MNKACLSAAACWLILGATAAGAQERGDAEARVERVLKRTPLIDGHNDLPWAIREEYDFWRTPLDLDADTAKLPAPLQTDLPRMRAGGVGGQYWSVWIPAALKGPEAVQTTLEQIDIVHRMVERYPNRLEMASTAADVRRIHKAGRIASMIGIEGGHQIGGSLAALREFHRLGVRYMTLTHSQHIPWADSATADPVANGLTNFGRAVIREMNRLGMIVDLSHVSAETMKDALEETKAPVIFSHSNARAVMDHPRNVPDEVLRLLPANGGVVMVNFYPGFLSTAWRGQAAARDAEVARIANLYVGQPERRKAALDAWEAANPVPAVTMDDVIRHIEHIRQVAGVDHVGIGSDFDGISGTSPQGLEGVDRYPALLAALARRGWSDAELAKLAGGNALRVMEAAERTAAAMKDLPPANATIEQLDAPKAP
jgi:membrane dipeptidase